MFKQMITEHTSLISQKVESDAVEVKDCSINRIFVIDCSWSMSSDLRELRTHLKNNIPNMIRDCDTVSIIWFASKGECGILQEGVKVKSLKDLKKLNDAIDKWLQPVGLTGFKEPLDLVREVAERLNKDGSISTMTFATDGYDNQWSESEILESIDKLNDVIAATTIVEYGYYCNHKLLDKMAEKVSGSLVFNKDYSSYEETLTNESQKVVLGGKRTIVKLENVSKYNFVVALTDTNDLLSLSINEENEVLVPAGVENITYLTEDKSKDMDDNSDLDIHTQFLAMIHVLSRKMLAIDVLDLLGHIGDVFLYKAFNNCFSKQDYAEFQDLVFAGIVSPDFRYAEGCDKDFKPKDDAFTVVELLNTLSSDKGNRFFPYHKGFIYNKISAKRVTKDKAVEEAYATLKEELSKSTDREATTKKFLEKYNDLSDAEIVEFLISDETKEAGFSLDGLVFNATRPNISARIRVEGDAIIPKNSFGLTTLKSHIYRNFAIVADGIKNIKVIPCRLTEDTFNKLKVENVVDGEYSSHEIYDIDISDLPVLNRKDVTSISATNFFNKEIDLLFAKAEQKVMKFYNDQLGNEKRSVSWDEKFGKDATDWLKTVGLTTYNGFNPPTVKSEDSDFYFGSELKTAIKSCSSLPTVKAVLKKINDGKKLTLSDKIMNKYIEKYQDWIKSGEEKTIEGIRAWIKLVSDDAISKTRSINYEISRIKMSIIVGHVWFNEFDSLDENNMIISRDGEDFNCTAKLQEVKVNL